MRLTQKIKSAIKLLKEIESDSEKCDGNYINLNNSKYFVYKNNLYNSQTYNKPVGTIKNGKIKLKTSMYTLKNAQDGIRKIEKSKSKSLKLKRKTFEPKVESFINSEPKVNIENDYEPNMETVSMKTPIVEPSTFRTTKPNSIEKESFSESPFKESESFDEYKSFKPTTFKDSESFDEYKSFKPTTFKEAESFNNESVKNELTDMDSDEERL